MGRGSSKAGGAKAKGGGTPSGITQQQLLAMPEDQRYDTVMSILNNDNIKVPDYLDDSVTNKLMYALGMNGKPTVVDDATLDSMQGKEIFRTVYESGVMPPPSSGDVLTQIREGDYTQMSGRGGSLHGRAIYFATDYFSSASYGHYEQNSQVMRAKINSNARIMSESKLQNLVMSDSSFRTRVNLSKFGSSGSDDHVSLWAISHGLDGWYSGNYTMMVNRGALTASSKSKSIYSANGGHASSWGTARDAK